jgi:hypothetical protein
MPAALRPQTGGYPASRSYLEHDPSRYGGSLITALFTDRGVREVHRQVIALAQAGSVWITNSIPFTHYDELRSFFEVQLLFLSQRHVQRHHHGEADQRRQGGDIRALFELRLTVDILEKEHHAGTEGGHEPGEAGGDQRLQNGTEGGEVFGIVGQAVSLSLTGKLTACPTWLRRPQASFLIE